MASCRVLGRRWPGGKCRAAMAKQIWLYSWLDAGMSLSCWMWNRTPEWHNLWAPPYGALAPVTIAPLA